MKLKIVLPVAFFAVLISMAAGAQSLKKCTSADGKVTYTDRECVAAATASNVNVSAGVASPDSTKHAGTAISQNMKTLYACDQGKEVACFTKEMLDKRCKSQSKEGTRYSDCEAYGADRNKFRELVSSCKNDNREGACATLSCIGGDNNACDRMKDAMGDREKTHGKRIEAAARQGLPAGKGWFMSQDWRDGANGSKAAIVTCNANTSIVLKKQSSMDHRILTSVTGEAVFLSIDEAAIKGCGKA
ncbi:hypothetical protein ACO0LM_24240 [Undibacterium sp. Di26W]|uniref:hypothetical protein n=1 Tax=Undibacterium sp. Di26W TaxID=3413035 RepID=UPI003BEF7D5D